MKVNKNKLIEALAYRREINSMPFDELDWSEFEKYEKVTEKEKERFQFTGLSNTDFYLNYLEENNEGSSN